MYTVLFVYESRILATRSRSCMEGTEDEDCESGGGRSLESPGRTEEDGPSPLQGPGQSTLTRKVSEGKRKTTDRNDYSEFPRPDLESWRVVDTGSLGVEVCGFPHGSSDSPVGRDGP